MPACQQPVSLLKSVAYRNPPRYVNVLWVFFGRTLSLYSLPVLFCHSFLCGILHIWPLSVSAICTESLFRIGCYCRLDTHTHTHALHIPLAKPPWCHFLKSAFLFLLGCLFKLSLSIQQYTAKFLWHRKWMGERWEVRWREVLLRPDNLCPVVPSITEHFLKLHDALHSAGYL